MLLEQDQAPRSINLHALTMALEATHDVVVITEAGRREGERGHRIVYVNAAFERMTGYTREEALGNTCAMLQGPKTDPACREKMRQALTNWQPVRVELINYRKDGSEFVVELQIDPLADETGCYTHWISVQRDITERREREDAHKQLEERLHVGISDVARLGMAQLDYVSGTVTLSARAAQLFALGVGETVCTIEQMHNTCHPDDAANLHAAVVRARDPRGSGWFEMDVRVVWPGAEVRWLRLRAQIAFKGEGVARKPHRGTLAAFDVTASKRAETELRARKRRFRDLAGGVAHDFNNLLLAIAGHTSILEAASSNPEAKIHTDAIEEATSTAIGLTQQLLDLSGRHVLPTEPLSVNACIEHLLEMSKPSLGAGISIRLDLAPDTGTVRMNRTRLNQILLNLLINARDAMSGAGTITLSTSLVRSSQDRVPSSSEMSSSGHDRFVQIQVTDSGKGIPADILKHIFEPYFSTKRRSEGPLRGLGLAIVQTSVIDSGGSIIVENTPDAGARFTVLLPRIEEIPHNTEPKCVVFTPSAPGTQTILLAEDDKRVRDLIHQFLSARGYRVLAAENGQAALEIAQRHPGTIDLLITDVQMPGLGGPRLARALTTQRPNISTLLMSGFLASSRHDAERFAPHWHLLQKPFSLSALLASITTLLPVSHPETRPD